MNKKETENKKSENKEESTSTPISKQTRYNLILSHIRYDGTCSLPIDFQLPNNIIDNEKGNFHLSYNEELDKLYFLTYVTSDIYKDENKEYQVYSIDNEMVFSNISDLNGYMQKTFILM
ncbi:hypothetical protein AB6H17_04635 [Proteus vulgaris]|uniref:hypothetical protein n=1 Tax=Proteus vulgaris TaxID=585 RepID=UPI0034DD5F09